MSDRRRSEYSEKLRDPRWQRKRLEVMQRDDFTCQSCCSTTNTLNVHHKFYEYGREPWEYEDDDLVTLCEACHTAESAYRSEAETRLLRALKKSGFLTWHLNELSEGLELSNYPGPMQWDPNVSALAWLLKECGVMAELREAYFEMLKNKSVKAREAVRDAVEVSSEGKD